MTNDPESCRGYDLIEEHFPFDPAEIVNEVVIVRSESLTVEGPAFRQHVDGAQPSQVGERRFGKPLLHPLSYGGRRDRGSGRFDENGLGAVHTPVEIGAAFPGRTARSAGVVAWAPRRDRAGWSR